MGRRFAIWVVVCAALQLASCGTYNSVHHTPDIKGYNNTIPVVTAHSDTLFSSGNNSLIKNKQQLWELYVEGDPLERGLVSGALSQKLVLKQERVFMDKVNQLVPSKFKQKMLRQFLKWYNRKLHLHVDEEYQAEIYGISKYSSPDYDYVAPQYLRSLYLHGAHDIGHVLSDLALVGCTSFAAWGEKTPDGSLLIARNFDFYAGDEFAEDKIVSFVRPDKGYPFMSVVWGGMVGTVSGMNLEGLTVTINSAKADMPFVAKTPISILAREILQYATTIDEAIAIVNKREVFVSESIMVGSAHDGRAVLIEVSPKKTGVYEVTNSNRLVCSNHFQSDTYKTDKNNVEAIANSHSQYRYERMNQLLQEEDKISPIAAAAIMRNTTGLNNIPLGYGNEKAINQLLAHHSIIFKPDERLVWVSSNPYQLGEYVAYDLDEVFGERRNSTIQSFAKPDLAIAEDGFVHSKAFKDYEEYRKQERVIEQAIVNGETLPNGFITHYQGLNPDNWKVYYNAGVYYYNKSYYTAARSEFEKALQKEITTMPVRKKVQTYVEKAKFKLN